MTRMGLLGSLLQVLGLALFLLASYLIFQQASKARVAEASVQKAEQVADEIEQKINSLQSLMRQESVRAQGVEIVTGVNQDKQSLVSALQKQNLAIQDINVYREPIADYDPSQSADGYLVLDILLSAALNEQSPFQLLNYDEQQTEFGSAVRLEEKGETVGYLLARWDGLILLDSVYSGLAENGYFALQHDAGPRDFLNLKAFGAAPIKWLGAFRVPIDHSGLFITIPDQPTEFELASNQSLVLLLLLGGLCLAGGFIWQRRAMAPQQPSLSLDEESFALQVQADPIDTPEPRQAEPRSPFELAADKAEAFLEDKQHKEEEVSVASKLKLSEEIFRAYDIRGIVGQTLDANIAMQIGQAIGSRAVETDATPVVIGRDGRPSGPDLTNGLIKGLTSTGCDVVDVGPVPTGALYYAAFELGCGSGVMVTGSHNPPDYNGLKIMLAGETLSGDSISGLYERIRDEQLLFGNGTATEAAILSDYQQRIASDIQLKRPIKVVVDCGNGIGGIAGPAVLEAIGAEVIPLFEEVDGSFPNHHPDPSEPENLVDLITSVKLTGADLGLAFDGDADRLGVVTASGEIVFPDRVMMLFITDILSRNPGSTIIYDVKCTGHLARIIAEAGGNPLMWKTGHSLIKEKMKLENSPFSGEMSGHFFFKERWYGVDDGIYAAARLLEILAASDQEPTEVLNQLPDSFSTPELKVHMQEGETHAFIAEFQEKASFEDAIVSKIDGLRADYLDRWGLVRSSNTTPVLVLRFDGDTEAALDQIEEEFREQLLAINPNLKLPF